MAILPDDMMVVQELHMTREGMDTRGTEGRRNGGTEGGGKEGRRKRRREQGSKGAREQGSKGAREGECECDSREKAEMKGISEVRNEAMET